ncbi:hypothetical protein [Plantibacter sp. LMC-P-059a]|uniref:hypothetical protein n=1 Tax=Plantibacter sp. LMC-P-059a TaxID=3040297 RepID=UPI00254B2847|nr:hypothetical protein [Plantibacter sp. LMC-P-059a]
MIDTWGGVRVAGWSARSLRNVTLGIAFSTFVEVTAGLWMYFSGLVGGTMTVLVLMFIGYFAPIPFKRREAEELSAGYTTLSVVHPDVPQRDPRTGAIIRLPGEAALTRKLWRERVAAAREGRVLGARAIGDREHEGTPVLFTVRFLRIMTVAVVVTSGVAIVISLAVTFAGASVDAIIAFVAFLLAVGAVFVLLLFFVMRSYRRRAALLREFLRTRRRSGDHAQLVIGGDELATALRVLDADGARRLRRSMITVAFVMSADTLSFWGVTPNGPEVIASFRAAEIESVGAPDAEAVRIAVRNTAGFAFINIVPAVESSSGAEVAGGSALRALSNALATLNHDV